MQQRIIGDEWISVTDKLPTPGLIVETKIDDNIGVRNRQDLKLIGLNKKLWFWPDGSGYVYYSPTHWRLKKEKQ